MKATGGVSTANDVTTVYAAIDAINKMKEEKKYKVALLFICLNEPYWEYIDGVIKGAKQFFLPGHDVDYLLWSDMPKDRHPEATIFETEGADWPLPTLMRYHLFLRQEEKLKEYDYIFYCDADMLFVNYVGDEILGEGLTAAQHPMYATRKELIMPLEPNAESEAHIKAPQFYFAGGFQGGTSASFIEAMKGMKKAIDADFSKNYQARWNDESHWNKYLFDHFPSVVLTPSYIYPDSLIEEYYIKIWGKNYPPRLVTLTKKFSTSSEGMSVLNETMKTL